MSGVGLECYIFNVTVLRLSLPGEVHVGKSADDLYDDLALALMEVAIAAVKDRQVFHLALSGGATPEPFYMRLVIDPRFRVIPWPQTHIWIVDERCVPDDDDCANIKMIREALIEHLPMLSRCVHPIPVMSDDPAGEYETELRSIFQQHAPRQNIPQLDFVLLGMGDDGHTASLFPQSPALNETQKLIAINQGPTVTPPNRVTMALPLLNAAHHLAVLVTGSKKTAALHRVAEQWQNHGPDAQQFPVTGIDPSDGELTWYLDPATASCP